MENEIVDPTKTLDAMEYVTTRVIPKDDTGLIHLNCVPVNHRIYKKETERFDFQNKDETNRIIDSMAFFCNSKRGLALAANQVGIDKSVLIIITGEHYISMFNPKIVSTSDETGMYEEGCLSYPGLFIKIKRPMHAKIRFADETGDVKTMTFTGMTARIIQHEIDHLNGIDFIKRSNPFHRDKAFKLQKRLLRRKE